MRATVQLLDLGDVLDVASGDGALAELLAPRAHSLTCIDQSARVVEAGAKRLAGWSQVRMLQGDMHALPLPDASFDLVLLLQALPYSEQPERAFAEAARVLRPGGRLLLTALDAHEHRATVAPYGHRNQGFAAPRLQRLAERAGLTDIEVTHGGVEARPPHFGVWVLSARAPGIVTPT
jgi:ArsR family transcriptional regulator